jgi:hypothetical protein
MPADLEQADRYSYAAENPLDRTDRDGRGVRLYRRCVAVVYAHDAADLFTTFSGATDLILHYKYLVYALQACAPHLFIPDPPR